MAITNGYATLAEFQLYVTMAGDTVTSDTNDSSVIEDIIEAVSRHIDNICGRVFYQSSSDTETRYYTPEDNALVFIDDLVSITTIAGDNDQLRTWPDALSSSDYDLQPYNASNKGWPYTWLETTPLTTAYFPTHTKGLKIVGIFGFPAVPDEIKAACLGIALNIYQGRTGQSSAGNVTVTQAGVIIRPTDVPKWAEITLSKYQRLI